MSCEIGWQESSNRIVFLSIFYLIVLATTLENFNKIPRIDKSHSGVLLSWLVKEFNSRPEPNH